jgi:hypothetical protein
VDESPRLDSSRRAYYSAPIADFCADTPDQILARLTRQHGFDLTGEQRDAWLEQVAVLKNVLSHLGGSIYLEFAIPRMGRRIDALAIIGPVIFIFEFKVGADSFRRQDLDQVVDYALDLSNFHEGSHGAHIAPVLVCTQAPDLQQVFPGRLSEDGVLDTTCVNSDGLAEAIARVLRLVHGRDIAVDRWEQSGYKPTPTIIEATLTLYREHSVADISRSDAGATNLSVTGRAVAEIIATARSRRQKAICLVTGVPGAGKTLVGLDAATRHQSATDDLYSVFLSGNGPLVAVLQEALARDKIRQAQARGEKLRKGAALSTVKAFIQNVHHFRDEYVRHSSRPPVEHVAIFDEAQRAWDLRQTADFMKRKKGIAGFSQSEPEFLISCLDRHPDWSVVIGLVLPIRQDDR